MGGQIGGIMSEKFDLTSARDNAEAPLASRVSEVESARDAAVIEKSALELSIRHLQEEKNALQVQLNQLQENNNNISSNFDNERRELEAKIATLSVQRDKLETDVTFAKEDLQRAQ